MYKKLYTIYLVFITVICLKVNNCLIDMEIMEILQVYIERSAKYKIFPNRMYLWNNSTKDFVSLVNESWNGHWTTNALVEKVINVGAYPVNFLL